MGEFQVQPGGSGSEAVALEAPFEPVRFLPYPAIGEPASPSPARRPPSDFRISQGCWFCSAVDIGRKTF